VSMEVPATSAGVLTEVRVPAGTVVPVGAIVAVVRGEGEAADAAASSPAPRTAERRGERAPAPLGNLATSAPQPSPQRREGVPPAVAAAQRVATRPLDPFEAVRTPPRNFGPARIAGGTAVTPLARRLAAESSIDLSRVRGSGPRGRIVAKDIAQAVGAGAAPAPGPSTAAPGGMTADQVKALYPDTPYEEIPLDNMRRTIARRLTEAKQSVPHFYLTLDIALDAVLKLREDANAAAGKGADNAPAFKLSINDFVIKALAAALVRVPAANAVWAEDRILRFKQSDIGVAVAIDGGLLTPVIRQAERKTLSAISNEMKDLAARARARKLKPDDYQGGASAISNLGMYGIREFSAIINPPQSTILAVGAGQRRAVETADGGVAFATMLTVTLSCDHRVVDGAVGAELLAAFKELMESPVRMLV